MDEPVVKASESFTKPNDGDAQITISSASRDRCVDAMVAADKIFQREIARAHRIERIAHGMVEAERMGCLLAVDRIGRARQRSRTERGFVHPRARIGKAARIAREHFHIGEAMMPEGHGLRGLHMGEARHDGFGMRLGLRQQCALKCGKSRLGARASLPHPEAEIGRHLIVARARRMKPPGRRSDDLGQPVFDIEVDVLEFALEDEAPLGDFGCDLVEPARYCARIVLRDDPLRGQHGGVRAGARQVLGRKPFVESDGGVYLLHDGSGAAFETSAPHLVRAHGCRLKLRPLFLAVAAGILAGLGAVLLYGMIGKIHAVSAPPPALERLKPAEAPLPVPQVAFSDAKGGRHILAQFKGRYVLLNLWATWCAPCVKELPALARLQKAVPGLQVVAVNVGRSTPGETAQFLAQHGAGNLAVYLDSNVALVRAFKAYGLPLSVLIDPKTREIARAEGPGEWDAPEAISYFRQLAQRQE